MDDLASETSSPIERWRWDVSPKIRISYGNHANRDELIWNLKLSSKKIRPKSASDIRRQPLIHRSKQ